MKVSELKESLSKMEDNDEIFVLMYEKGEFDFPDDDEMWLPPDKWATLVAKLEETCFDSLWSDIHDAVVDYAEINPNWSEEE